MLYGWVGAMHVPSWDMPWLASAAHPSVGNHGRLFDLAHEISQSGNSTQILLNLITVGEEWQRRKSVQHSFQDIPTYWERVAGCMADARIGCLIDEAIQSGDTSPATGDTRVTVDGIADSRVAQGMLALLSEGLTGSTIDSILALSASDLLTRTGLDTLLPPGRLNGLSNMIALIQSQVRALVGTTSDVPDPQATKGLRDTRSQEVAVLLSGGVDSSVALKLLQLQGYAVRAFYLKIWLEDEVAHLNECPWEEDLTYAQQVCDQLNVPLETISLQKEYWSEVVQYTFDEAKLGRTPNPDIMCNSRSVGYRTRPPRYMPHAHADLIRLYHSSCRLHE